MHTKTYGTLILLIYLFGYFISNNIPRNISQLWMVDFSAIYLKLHCKNVKLHCKYYFLIGFKAANFLLRKFTLWVKNKYGGRQEYERSKSANLEPSSLHEWQNDANAPPPKIQPIALALVGICIQELAEVKRISWGDCESYKVGYAGSDVLFLVQLRKNMHSWVF